ncbi:MAG: polysaccharide biosynthesis C-terminal domain-containing protein, partial [Planctomycetaceae bacterium]|nr:polysaccharide biosynthesis C-terminal domain-containing protein [Planctomycetaceae bacterium]
LYTIVDTIFVSRFVNTNALSAINIVTPAINFIVGLGAMLATGGTAIIGRKLGAGREAEARSDLTQLTLTGAVLGLAIAVVGSMSMDAIVAALGASDILHPYARDYLSILLLFTPASMVQVLFSMFFIAAGRPGLGMVAGVLGGVVNAVFDYLFIVEFGMGITGAAVATGMGYMVPAIIGLGFFPEPEQPPPLRRHAVQPPGPLRELL